MAESSDPTVCPEHLPERKVGRGSDHVILQPPTTIIPVIDEESGIIETSVSKGTNSSGEGGGSPLGDGSDGVYECLVERGCNCGFTEISLFVENGIVYCSHCWGIVVKGDVR